MFDPSLTQLIRTATRAFLSLASMASAAEDIQWEQSPLSGPVDANASHSDTVADTVCDPRRLAVRRAYEEARVALADLIATLRRATSDLETAIGNWEGK